MSRHHTSDYAGICTHAHICYIDLVGQSLEGGLAGADVVVDGAVSGIQRCQDCCASSLVLGLHVSQAVSGSGCVQVLGDGDAKVGADVVVDVDEELGVDRSILAGQRSHAQ